MNARSLDEILSKEKRLVDLERQYALAQQDIMRQCEKLGELGTSN